MIIIKLLTVLLRKNKMSFTNPENFVKVVEDYANEMDSHVRIKYHKTEPYKIYIPKYVVIKPSNNCVVTIDDIVSIPKDNLVNIRNAMVSGIITQPCHICGGSDDTKSTWNIEYSDKKIKIEIDFADSLLFNHEIVCDTDHIDIFNALIRLKECIEKMERFITPSRIVKVTEEFCVKTDALVLIRYHKIDPKKEYEPEYVKFKLSEDCVVNIDDFASVSITDLQKMRYSIGFRDFQINNKNDSPSRIFGLSENKDTAWMIGYADQKIYVEIDLQRKFLFKQEIDCTEDHLKIFDILLKLRRCIEERKKFVCESNNKDN